MLKSLQMIWVPYIVDSFSFILACIKFHTKEVYRGSVFSYKMITLMLMAQNRLSRTRSQMITCTGKMDS
ncbi:hypothetical protein Hanom_Chr16g01477661 [Helianthus anomalus]